MNKLIFFSWGFIFSLFGLSNTVLSQSLQDNERAATVAYQEGRYQDALTLWKSIQDSGTTSAGVYFNIGQAESQLHHIPEAIIAFEQANRIKPMNKQINQALSVERKNIENGTIPVPPFFLVQWYKGFVAILRPGSWAMLGLIFILMLVVNSLGALRLLFVKRFLPKKWTWIVGVFGFLFVVIAISAFSQLYRKDEAVIMLKGSYRKAPSEESPEIRILYPGEKATIKDQIGDWYYVSLLNLDMGWIKKESLKSISIR